MSTTDNTSHHCKNCAHFTFDVPDDEPGKPIFFKRGVHGLCKGATFHPRHIEHRDSIRCVWFVSKEQHAKDTALSVEPATRGRSKLFKA